MSVRGVIATAANAAWYASALPGERQFRAALHDPRRAQETILFRYLQRNANTTFGRLARFSELRSVAEFQQRVPLHDHDALAPLIDRIASGEPNVLTAEPVRRLATSSGSTRARKLIPHTTTLQREFDRAIGPWIVDLFRRDPSLMRGCAYWSITPNAPTPQNRHPHGPPIGFDEDSAYLGGVKKLLVDAVMAVPGGVRHIANAGAFRRETLRHLIACGRDLRLISVWHPSFLELLLDADDASPRPRDWRATWPNLRVVSCWTDAHAAGPAAALAARLPGVAIQPKGLLATEAFVTIPYANARPVAIRSHFYEFIDARGTARLVDELEAGRSYAVVVTTGGGLWRYRLGDRVEVEGFVGRTPSLKFVGRDDRVSDRFGEKLSEGFVGRAVREVLQAAGVAATFAMLAPEQVDGRWRYTLFLQSADRTARDLDARLDAALRDNPHYDHCRNLGQLAHPAAFVIRADAFASYAEELSRNGGMRLGDIKPSALSEKTNWADVFDGDYVVAARDAADASG